MNFKSKLSQEDVFFRELLVKDYRQLLKSLFGEDVEEFVFTETLLEILCSVTNHSRDYFKQMDIVDLFCLLLDLKINCLGDICPINVTAGEKKLKVQLNLEKIRNSLQDLLEKVKTPIEVRGVKIQLQYPSLNRFNKLADEEYLGFIKAASFKDVTININSNEESKFFFDNLPVDITFNVVERIQYMYNELISLNFLEIYNITDTTLNFIPTISNLIWYTKLLYEEPLDVFYKNFFYMSYYGHMNSSYLDNISIGEYNFFVNCLRNALAPEKSQTNTNDSPEEDLGEDVLDN